MIDPAAVRAGWAGLLLIGACAHPAGAPRSNSAPAALPPAVAQDAGTAEPCPRVERASPMSTGYAGWARDIPVDDMVLALDVVVPIQERLGRLFCARELADCRPKALQAVELADNRPSAASLLLRGVARAPERQLSLRLTFSEAAQWQADAASLEAYLAACRAPEPVP